MTNPVYRYDFSLEKPHAQELAVLFNLYGGIFVMYKNEHTVHDSIAVDVLWASSDNLLSALCRAHGTPSFLQINTVHGVHKILAGDWWRTLWVENSPLPERIQRLLTALEGPLHDTAPRWERDVDLFRCGLFQLTLDLHRNAREQDFAGCPVEYMERVIHYIRKRLAQWCPSDTPRSAAARLYVEASLAEVGAGLHEALEGYTERGA